MTTERDPYELLTRPEAAEALRINVSYLTHLTQTGQLHSVRIGRRVLIPRLSLEAFIRGEPSPAQDGNWPGTPSMFNRNDDEEQKRAGRGKRR